MKFCIISSDFFLEDNSLIIRLQRLANTPNGTYQPLIVVGTRELTSPTSPVSWSHGASTVSVRSDCAIAFPARRSRELRHRIPPSRSMIPSAATQQ